MGRAGRGSLGGKIRSLVKGEEKGGGGGRRQWGQRGRRGQRGRDNELHIEEPSAPEAGWRYGAVRGTESGILGEGEKTVKTVKTGGQTSQGPRDGRRRQSDTRDKVDKLTKMRAGQAAAGEQRWGTEMVGGWGDQMKTRLSCPTTPAEEARYAE